MVVYYFSQYLVVLLSCFIKLSSQEGQPGNMTEEISACIDTMKRFLFKYNKLGCDKMYDYVLDVDEMQADCKRGDEDIRVVYSKLETIGDHVFTTEHPCSSRRSKHGRWLQECNSSSIFLSLSPRLSFRAFARRLRRSRPPSAARPPASSQTRGRRLPPC